MTADSPFARRRSVEQVELGDELCPRFDSSGLIPAIVQEAASGAVLMLGYMNAEALGRTIATRHAHFWSRTRQAIWRKGEHSGFTQWVESLSIDDDQDAILLKVRLDGPGSCHVGFYSCFYRNVDFDRAAERQWDCLLRIEHEQIFDAGRVYDGLPNPTLL